MIRYICTYKACPSNQHGELSGWSDYFVNNRVLGNTIEERRAAYERLHRTYFHQHGHLHKIKRVRKKTTA